MKDKEIFVYRNDEQLGTLYVNFINGKESFSFEYDECFLKKSDKSFILDADINFFPGRQYLPINKNNFGFINDCLPDRWGRNLIKRDEQINAKRENRPVKKIYESDYLTRLDDSSRIGDIRFKLDKNKNYVSSSINAIPDIIYINKLEQSSLELEKDKNVTDNLKILLSPGSSLGGARPKANVYDGDGNMWLCKFPSKNDEYDIELFEKVCLDLQQMCSIRVSESKLMKISKYGSTLLIKRFDRNKEKRIHYISAMNAIGATDGENDEYSYLDLLSFIKANCKDCKNESLELFRRIVFSILVKNTDNHLRNHGYCYIDNRWILSPSFDVNPNPYRDYLSLGISSEVNELNLDYLKSLHSYFNLKEEEASDIINTIKNIISLNWKKIADKYKASNKDISFISSCFENY